MILKVVEIDWKGIEKDVNQNITHFSLVTTWPIGRRLKKTSIKVEGK